MRKIFTLLIFSFPFLCLAQSDIQGDWKLSPVKMLRLKADQSFHLTKGAYHHYGNYDVLSGSDNAILRLYFETVTIDYKIISSSFNRMQLLDTRNNDIINARKVGAVRQEVNEVVETEPPVRNVDVEQNDEYKNLYRNVYPDNMFYLSLAGNGGGSWVSGPTTQSFKEEIGNLTEEFSTSATYSYGGGFKLGYQVSEGMYAGSGASYSLSGFVATRKASTSDPDYQFDAESSQTAKYTYSSIEIPFWVNYRITDRWMVELGGLASLPIRSTSRALFQGENTVWINGEIDNRTSYSTDEYSQDYPNILEDYALGGYAEIQRRLTRNLVFSLSYKYVNEFMQFDSAPISNNLLHANLILQLF